MSNYDWSTVVQDLSNLSTFRTYNGTWSASNGEITVLSTDHAKALSFDSMTLNDTLGSYNPPRSFSDGDVELNIRVVNSSSTSDAGFLFRVGRAPNAADPEGSGYYVGLNAAEQKVVLCRLDGGRTILAQAACPIAANAINRLRVEARGPQINIFLNGELDPIIAQSDPTFRTGSYGLAAYGTEAAFSQLSIVAHSLTQAPQWYTYPNGSDALQDLSPLDWNGSSSFAMDGWYAWWWEHLPKNGGGHDATDLQTGTTWVLLNTWWPYVFDINGFSSTLPSRDIVFPPEDLTPPTTPASFQGLALGG